MNRLKRMFSRGAFYNELSEEIQQHPSEKIEELLLNGMAREEAEHAAPREFGNTPLIREDSRAVWRWPAVESFFADIRYALRTLRQNPGFAAVLFSQAGHAP